jgi:charged multivesicular body protein 4
MAALRRKRVSQATMGRLAETRLQLEVQVNMLESAYLNVEAAKAMKKASDALRVIHRNLCVC